MIWLDSKQVSEVKTLAVEWSTALNTGVTISSGTVTAIRLDTGVSVSGTLLTTTTLTISGTKTVFTVQAGVAGVVYQLTLTVTLSNGNVLKEEATMAVEGT
jgi:hypothetical protein